MYAETLGMGRARSEQQRREFADVIVRESDSLSRMVNRILDFSASQRHGLRYHPELLDVSGHLQQLADAFALHVRSREARLESQVDPGLTANVDADALSHAVLNLIENAVKYTLPGGSVRVSATEAR